MPKTLGLRREDKNQWERRTPLTPEDVTKLIEEHGIDVVVQPSPIRIFPDSAYEKAGAVISEDLSHCDVVMGVKEMPAEFFTRGGTYLFFSHTIKGQPYNMPMLQRLMDLECTLFDYEKIEDEKKRRLVFFGKHAGLAGMIDGLWMLGRRFHMEGIDTPLQHIRQAKEYGSLEEAKGSIAAVGEEIKTRGLPEGTFPLVIGFAGYGHVSQGAQEILDSLPHREVTPRELLDNAEERAADAHHIIKVVFKEEDLVVPIDSSQPFQLQDYYDHPEKYNGIFNRYLPHLTLLVNCIFWTPRYPRLITKEEIVNLYAGGKQPHFRGVADISCDPEGSVEFTTHCTDPGSPTYVYLPESDTSREGFHGHGPVILAVDNLPSEISNESSSYFSHILMPFIPALVACNFDGPIAELDLPEPLKRALILHNGELTPPFHYMQDYLERRNV